MLGSQAGAGSTFHLSDIVSGVSPGAALRGQTGGAVLGPVELPEGPGGLPGGGGIVLQSLMRECALRRRVLSDLWTLMSVGGKPWVMVPIWGQ